jgi:hypothetical protein
MMNAFLAYILSGILAGEAIILGLFGETVSCGIFAAAAIIWFGLGQVWRSDALADRIERTINGKRK